jgi:hypothetical protein
MASRMSEENREAEIETLGSVIKRQEEIEAKLKELEKTQQRTERKLDLLLAQKGIT